jgi:beta-lactamase class A
MRIAAIVAAAFLMQSAAAHAAAQPSPKSGLTRLLEAEAARFDGKAGLYVKHLGTGEEAGVNATDRFETASTIKVPVMVLAFKLADEKKLNLDERYTLKASDMRGGSGIFRHHDLGLSPTIRDILLQMVITSDNSATDIMIAKDGGKDAVNAYLKREGYNNLVLNGTVFEFFRLRYETLDAKYRALTPEDMFALGSNREDFRSSRAALIAEIEAAQKGRNINEEMAKLAGNESRWLGISSPADMGRMLEGIEKCTIASKAACDEMKRMMRAQQAGTRKIPHYLDVPVAHKTGEVGGVTNDVGIVYARSGPIVMSFFTMGFTGPRVDADVRLGHVARLVVEYFDGVRNPL